MEINPLRELLRILIRSLGFIQKEEATCCGVSLAQCHTIVEIGRAEKINLNELSYILNLDNSTLSRTVNNLAIQGYVMRETDPNDRRYINIYLTEKGKEVYKLIEGTMNTYYNNILNSIPSDKKEQVIESLNILINAVKVNKCCVEKEDYFDGN